MYIWKHSIMSPFLLHLFLASSKSKGLLLYHLQKCQYLGIAQKRAELPIVPWVLALQDLTCKTLGGIGNPVGTFSVSRIYVELKIGTVGSFTLPARGHFSGFRNQFCKGQKNWERKLCLWEQNLNLIQGGRW